MSGNHYIYLVPGFFGFTSLGAYTYFYRVEETLLRIFREKYGMDVTIINCRTQPTASIKHRADFLLQEVIDSGGLEAKDIHFIGHSLGGLDVRLLVTPGVRLRPGTYEETIGSKTRNVITISTPHFGTPLANFFTTFQGRHILQLLTSLANNQVGRHAVFLASQLISFVASVDDIIGRKETFLDFLVHRLLSDLSIDENDPIWRFLHEIESDQGAIIQLTPEGMHLYNAAVSDRPDTKYSCVITAVPKPSPVSFARLLVRSPFAAINYLLFAVLYSIASRQHSHYPYPSPAGREAQGIQKKIPFSLGPATNDGIAPTLSQIYGRVLGVEVADHMDVIGQFAEAGGEPFTNWVESGAYFSERNFVRVLTRIANFIAGSWQSKKIQTRSGTKKKRSARSRI